MWILELLGIVLLLGGVVVGAVFYAAILTGLAWMFFTGLEIVTTPVLTCASDCFRTVSDSKSIGWIFIATPILFIILFAINGISNSSVSERKVK